MNELKKCAEILVERGYAQKYEPYGAVYRVIVNYKIESCNPFIDTLEGRRQADAIEDWLYGYRHDMWEHSKQIIEEAAFCGHDGVTPILQSKWRLDRIKWCLEQLCKEEGDE